MIVHGIFNWGNKWNHRFAQQRSALSSYGVIVDVVLPSNLGIATVARPEKGIFDTFLQHPRGALIDIIQLRASALHQSDDREFYSLYAETRYRVSRGSKPD